LILIFHKLIIFYRPKFIKLKPAIKKITSQTKPLIRKKVKLPNRKYLPNLFFVKSFLNQTSKGMKSINQI
tara:strand:- start:818 stop:1027 length:210 start_codon:yes stop_codon:yes gene_type:complete